MNTSIKLILLDRDGVINRESEEFIKEPAEWLPLPGALEAIVQLQRVYTVAVCTNQSGVGRKLLDEQQLAAIHDKLNTSLVTAGGAPVDVFYCPHLPEDHCRCRKPAPGLLDTAMRATGTTPEQTLYLGDSIRDLEAATAAGCGMALVLSGNGRNSADNLHPGLTGTAIYRDLADFADSQLAS